MGEGTSVATEAAGRVRVGVPLEAHLQGERQRQVSFHLSTGGQHDLVGPQDPLGALGQNKTPPSSEEGILK